MTTCTIVQHRREDTKHFSEVIICHDGVYYLSRLPYLIMNSKFDEQFQIAEFHRRQKRHS